RKKVEIDLVGLNNKTKQALFTECKWKNNADAREIAKELSEKTGALQWHNRDRTEAFAIFAKTFKQKISEHQGKRVYCYDLKDIGKTLKTS
ncbi:ATP-binding protein, partial [Candidatus Micrarchaeota archaeon]|nr:ATP-binding protein [Candidatus Micrarchaeota archaeon]